MAYIMKYPSLRDRGLSVRSKPISASRTELVNSIHRLSSNYASSDHRNVKDAEYYLSSSKQARRQTRVLNWLYNRDTGQVMGRGPLDWLRLFIFFLFFYGSIAGFFAACMGVFMYTTVMVDYPHVTGHYSALSLNPGLGVIPQPDDWTSLIGFGLQKDSYRKYVDDLVAFTQWYEDYGRSAVEGAVRGGDDPFANCPRTPVASMDTRRACRQKLDMSGRCNMFQEFGFDEGMPCLILKLNRIYGWIPDPLDNHTGVLVRCYGRSDIDKDLLGGVCYHDDNDPMGKDLCKNDYGEFKSHYFPYLKQINYQSPLVFVEFLKPARNTVIMIECRAYAKNIRYDKVTGEGAVRFELLVD